ncbi:MAG: hypothetical protein KIT56_08500 [Gammaproteobacteria bacterium]|nr:hypothetical protein [Gammaproteobacteria bacterium]MCW5583900.1 hypothetical protein [Gammaproteobacteria bacterium]
MPKITMQDESLFKTAYLLTINKNESELANLIENGFHIDTFQAEYNLIMLVAKEKDVESVEFLSTKFHANLDYALQGYAIGDHTDKVEELINHGFSIDIAIKGYAIGGHNDKVENLIKRRASLDEAVLGYAIGGHKDKVENMLSRRANLDDAVQGYARGGRSIWTEELIQRGASLNAAVWGYARGGHYAQVEELIKRGASLNAAVWGYARGGYFTQVEELAQRGASLDYVAQGYKAGKHFSNKNVLLRLLSITNNQQIREHLADEAKKKNNSLDTKILLGRANKLNRIMNEYKLDYEQSKFLTIPGSRVWLLQGPKCPTFTKEGTFQFDLFCNVTSMVIGLSPHEVNKVFTAVNNHLFQSIKNSLNIGFFALWRTPEKTRKLNNIADQKYQRRCISIRAY